MAKDRERAAELGDREGAGVLLQPCHLESEGLVEGRVQCLPMDFGLIFLLLVWEEEDFDIRV
jgi:hypothetical protein